MFKVSKYFMLVFSVSLFFISCSKQKTLENLENSLSKSISSTFIVSRSPENLATNIDVGDSIIITFDRNLSSASVNTETIKIQNSANKTYVDGKTILTGNKLEFIPLAKFVPSSTNTTVVTAIKPNSNYIITLSKSIKDSFNTPFLQEDVVWSFTTSSINYGLYWFGPNGEAQKYLPNKTNLFYSDSKPTIIYSHGWQSGSSKNDYWMEQPYVVCDKYSSFNKGKNWINKGYNIGAFVWTQLADEDEVKDAEAKIWKAQNGFKNMRYRLSDNTYKDFGGSASVGDIFFNIYSKALVNNRNSITLAGHSLGNQVVTKLTENIMNSYESGSIAQNLIPKRITLLDPFWSKDGKSYLNNIWTGAKCREIINKAISNYTVAVEQYKTTAIGGTITGDENLDMRKMTAFYRIWPDFIPVQEAGTQHSYAYVWYFDSIAYSISVTGGVAGASSNISDLKNTMNYGKPNLYYFYNTGSGNKTPTSSDDTFIKGSGITTW